MSHQNAISAQDVRPAIPGIRRRALVCWGVSAFLAVAGVGGCVLSGSGDSLAGGLLGAVLMGVVGAYFHRCPGCGHPLERVLHYCPQCGSRLRDPSGASPPNLIPGQPGAASMGIPPRLRVLEDSAECLRFRFRRSWLAGIALSLVGFTFLAGACHRDVVECRRNSKGSLDCRVYRSFLGLHTRPREVTGVQGAHLEGRRPAHRPGRLERNVSTRVVLDTDNGPVPVENGFSYIAGSDPNGQLAERINRFARQSTPARTAISEGSPWWLWCVVGVFPAIGIGLLTTPPDEIRLRYPEGLFQVVRRGFSGSRELTYPVDSIAEFGLVRSGQWDEQHQRERVRYFLAMRLTQGMTVHLYEGLGWTAADTQWKRTVAGFLEHRRQRALRRPPPAASPTSEKRCAVCGQDCSGAPRYQDTEGHYYHQACVADPETR